AYSSGEQGEDLVRDQVRLGEGHRMPQPPPPKGATTGMSAALARLGLDELLAHGPFPSSAQASGPAVKGHGPRTEGSQTQGAQAPDHVGVLRDHRARRGEGGGVARGAGTVGLGKGGTLCVKEGPQQSAARKDL